MSENSAGINEGSVGLFDRAKHTVTRLKERLTPEPNLTIWIADGLNLIKSGEFDNSIAHFKNEERLKREFKKLRVNIYPGMYGPLVLYETPISIKGGNEVNENTIQDLIGAAAMNSRLSFPGQIGLLPPEVSVFTAREKGTKPSFLQLGVPKLFINNTEAELPIQVKQNLALLYAEEWIHLLQYESGKPLAGDADPEQDVLKYLLNKGVPLTSEFTERYNRKSKISR